MIFKGLYLNPSNDSGSPSIGEPEFLAVGKLRKPHGVRGEIKMTVWTEFPERLTPGVSLFIGDDFLPVTIRTVRWHNEDLLIAFEGIMDRNQAGEFRNQVINRSAEDVPELSEGEFYLHDLLGLQVIREDSGDTLGEVIDFIETGANDVYVVQAEDGSETLIPAIDDVIKEIDLEKGIILITPLPGLLPGTGN